MQDSLNRSRRNHARLSRALIDVLEDRRMLALVAVNDGGQTVEPHVTGEDVQLDVAAGEGLLVNDTTEPGAEAVYVGGPEHGTVDVFADGSYTYTPEANYNGTDSFEYRLVNGMDQSNVAVVTISIFAVNDAPTAQDDDYTIGKNHTLRVPTLAGVMSNDSDEDIVGETLNGNILLVSQALDLPIPAPDAPIDPMDLPAHGDVTLNPDGSFVYTPDADYVGLDSFTYYLYDSLGAVGAATVTITVTEEQPQLPPVAMDDAYSVDEDNTLTKDAAEGIKANDGDVNGDAFTLALLTQPAHGDITSFNTSTGAFTYVPDANFNGTDSFTYRGSDGANGNIATVTITVESVNDAPTAPNITVLRDPGQNKDIVIFPSLSDPDGQQLDFVIETQPGSGTAVRGSNATPDFLYDDVIRYIPDGSDPETDTFTYRVSDGVTSTVGTITVNRNQLPVAPELTVKRLPGQSRTIDVLATASDPDGQEIDFGIAVQPEHGTVTRDDNGTPGDLTDDVLVYTPDGTDPASDLFAYSITDGSLTRVAAVIVNVDLSTVALVVNPFRAYQQDLVVTGSDDADNIVIVEKDNGTINVTVNDIFRGNFAPTGFVIVNGGFGNDTITAAALKRSNILYGGSGADTIIGGGRNDILVGGGGSDRLEPNAGRNIAIGGDHTDTILAVGLGNIFVSGKSSYESPTSKVGRRALEDLMVEWSSSRNFSTRSLRVRTGVGTSGALFSNATITDDAAAPDSMTHVDGPDLFFRTDPDVINGAITSDQVYTI